MNTMHDDVEGGDDGDGWNCYCPIGAEPIADDLSAHTGVEVEAAAFTTIKSGRSKTREK